VLNTVSIMWLVLLASLASLFVDSPIVDGTAGAFAAVGVILGALALRPLEGNHLARAILWVMLLMAVPALWMVIQLIPMPISLLAHPIWASAREALVRPLSGHMTIDIGDTLTALGQYLTVSAVVMLSAFVTIDRRRAETILWLLAAAATFAALILIIDRIAGSTLIRMITPSGDRTPFEAMAAVGVPLTVMTIDWAVERFETRGLAGKMSKRTFFHLLGTCISGFAVCLIAIVYAAPAEIAFAAAYGAATLAIVVLIRRLALGKWAAGVLIVGAIFIGALFALNHGDASIDPTLRFASDASVANISVAQRMLADNWRGSGAGTFAALLPIYADAATAGLTTAPSVAAQLAIEFGKPAYVIWVLLVLTIIGLLLKGGFERGRDSFYPAGAAGCLVTFLVESFVDSSVFAFAVATLAATILGLGLAQRLSRTA
jgi:hypothetical protein